MRPMETYETQREYWRLLRKMGTRETQRDQLGLMRLRETTGNS